MAKTYSVVPGKSAGDVFTEAMWDDYIQTNVNNLRVPAACRIRNSSVLSAANSAFTTLTFNSERFDTDGMHSTSVNTARITFTTAGIYLVGAAVYWQANATGIRTIRIMLNGTTALCYNEFPAGGIAGPGQVINTVYDFAVNDYITVDVFQTSGVALNLESSAAYSPEAWAVWLGQTS